MMPTILVVGAGPGGLMAAYEAHRRGAHVILIDEALRPGGRSIVNHPLFSGPLLSDW